MESMLLGKITTAQFLKQYWQKKPLLVRGAFPGFRDPITPDQLAGLALEEDVDSRLVMERGGKKPWEVTMGPQSAAKLRKLPRSHWTLLVQGVDRYVPGVAAMLEPFHFIPDWRVEDIMVSFAPKAGTVGPHIDSYDVFLIQGKGRRRWQLDPAAGSVLRAGLDLRILKKFTAKQDWVLEPGDMLYLPPNLAHYGTALEDCLTYSVGFRAPSGLDLLLAAQEKISRSGTASARYSDSDLRSTRARGEIPRAAVQRLRQLMESTLKCLDDAEFDALVGSLVTEPKGSATLERHPVLRTAFETYIRHGDLLVRAAGVRAAYLKLAGRYSLFANGERFDIPKTLGFAAPFLTDQRLFTQAELAPHLKKPGFKDLLLNLTCAGIFQFQPKRSR